MSSTSPDRWSVLPRSGRWAGLTRTDRWVLGWWAVNLVVFAHVVLFAPPLWVTYVYNFFLYAIGLGVSYYSGTIRKLLILGTIAGVLELGVDHFLVAYTGTLVYPDSLPMLVSSPLYMPIAWALVTVHLGYLGIRIGDVYGRKAATVVPAVCAVGLFGLYETGAYFAGIWWYVDAPLAIVGHAPLYIVAAEAIQIATLSEIVRRDRPVLGGVAFAGVITVTFVGTYVLFGAVGAALG